ncbi:TonB family protein [Hymenobacter guriensis]|uniref:TonB family protein n=1 Tax=Hymenobacter guriensis TaxID=2793065 RepID=A0ABS0KXF1_9BACT|nr:TonB family protein [Hymenobacter guriensis]MBG8552548.1 TonB family protein [Hymenobacter guriensis]
MIHSLLRSVLLTACLMGGSPLLLRAQESKKVYTYVEQMPYLPGGVSPGALQAAILKAFRYPADAKVEGRAVVQFTVNETGQVQDATVVKGLSPSIDAAILAAVGQLPRFEPGKQNGQRVAVSFTIPLQLALPSPAGSSAGESNTRSNIVQEVVAGRADKVPEQGEEKVYTYVEQMPQWPGGGGNAAISAAILKNVALPADTPEGRVFISFIVKPTGEVSNAKITKGLSPAIDAAVLAAVGKLPRFEPGKQNGRTVSVNYPMLVNIYRPDHVFETREVATRARFAPPGLFSYLQRHLKVPAVVSTEKLRGWVGVDFVVQASGKIVSPTLTSHVCESCDAEVLRLVQSFPAWVPARDHAGSAVAVRQHVDVPLPLPDPSVPFAKPENVGRYAQKMPSLLDGTPVQELGQLLSKTLIYPETARKENIVGTANVSFIVDANGIVREPRLTQSVCRSCDQAILDALKALGPLVPGRQGEQPVPVEVSVSIPFSPTTPAASGK